MSAVLPTRLARAEALKIRTTRAWWLFVGGFAVLSALTALLGWESSHNQLYPTLSDCTWRRTSSPRGR